jgi:hypothetical protein
MTLHLRPNCRRLTIRSSGLAPLLKLIQIKQYTE